MNILLLNVNTGRPSAWGGIEAHTEILGTLLHKKGHKVTMGCFAEGSVKLNPEGVILPSRRVTMRNSGDIRAIVGIIGIVRKGGIRLIIANNGREYWPAVIAAGICGAKVIFVRHQVDRIRKTTRWLIANRVNRVVAVSKAVRDALLRSGVPPGKIAVIHNSIPLEQFSPARIDRAEVRRELGIGSDDIVVGLVGKLNRGKGVYDALAAVGTVSERHPGVRLLYVGEGPERTALEEEAERMLLREKVIFAGLRRDVARMYAAMDIFTLPSTCEEAFGMVLIEAMAMAKPVVATRVGGIPEIIDHEVSGLLVPPHDAAALASALSRLIDDRQFSGKIAEEGLRLVERKFSDKAMGDSFERVITQVFDDKPRDGRGRDG
jgi:glycosyltransferase involved in cell wall biosynthesis